MYLKRIETSGFKSFANKTDLDFPRGVTAIVGPNGSGKSNIADAVKWVLGEQSMKSLRSKKGEDVIFTGSSKKAKMSAASVSLFLDNNDKKIPIDYDEVVLTRKLFRNGDSEYLINKNRVRLSDIVDLLVKSGVSQRGYCVINQGMADSILAASPTERMVIFEEATGVRAFQIKKNQTIKKLEATRRNMTRVTDLLVEIEPRLSFLKRQASRALRRGEVEKELRDEQNRLYSAIWAKLNRDNKTYRQQKDDVEKILNESEKDVEALKKQLEECDGKDVDYSQEFEKLRNEIDQIQGAMNELRKNLSMTEGRIEIENEKKVKIENPEFIPINLRYVKEQLTNIINIINKLAGILENCDNPEKINEAKGDSIAIKNSIDRLYKEVQAGKVSQKTHDLQFDDSKLKELEKEKIAIGGKIDDHRKKYEEVRSRIGALSDEERQKRKAFYEYESRLRIRQEEIGRLKDNMNRIGIELAKFEVRKEDLTNEVRDEFGMSHPIYERIEKNITDEGVEHENIDIDESRQKVRRLKVQHEQIGGIDPLVVEEYEETLKRFEFLSAQSKDLEQASESLRKVIGELDEKIEKRFKSCFKNISDEFDRYFKIIFSGGKANLSIKYEIEKDENDNGDAESVQAETGEVDEVENEMAKRRIAGIEVNVAPPGKKIASLDMLSGGERALTSIAILFAIIANNPPPFSVLDEIDAALDEANSAKLSAIIKEVSKNTQFILITHNREMMKQADILYGVTMHDDGVSKIISIKLEEIRGK